MTTTNDTTAGSEKLQDESKPIGLGFVASSLDLIVGITERFKQRAEEGGVSYDDFIKHTEASVAVAQFFADDELTAINPGLCAKIAEFEESDHIGEIALGRYIYVSILVEHPEILQLAVQRCREQLRAALVEGVLPDAFEWRVSAMHREPRQAQLGEGRRRQAREMLQTDDKLMADLVPLVVKFAQKDYVITPREKPIEPSPDAA